MGLRELTNEELSHVSGGEGGGGDSPGTGSNSEGTGSADGGYGFDSSSFDVDQSGFFEKFAVEAGKALVGGIAGNAAYDGLKAGINAIAQNAPYGNPDIAPSLGGTPDTSPPYGSAPMDGFGVDGSPNNTNSRDGN